MLKSNFPRSEGESDFLTCKWGVTKKKMLVRWINSVCESAPYTVKLFINDGLLGSEIEIGVLS